MIIVIKEEIVFKKVVIILSVISFVKELVRPLRFLFDR